MEQAVAQEGAPKPLVQIAGPVEGGFRVINVWASQDDVDAIVQVVNRIMQSKGISVPGSSDAIVKRTINPVHRLEINATATTA